MSILKTLEEKILFGFTRGLSLIIVVLLLVALIFGIIAYFYDFNNSTVAYSEVKKALQPYKSSAVDKKTEDESVDPKVASILKKYINTKENIAVVDGWIGNMDKESQKSFLLNLATLLERAEKDSSKKFEMHELINSYKDIKVAKMAGDPFTKNIMQFKPVIIGSFIIIILGLIGLFSLILVLLAIERNTRNEHSSVNHP